MEELVQHEFVTYHLFYENKSECVHSDIGELVQLSEDMENVALEAHAALLHAIHILILASSLSLYSE